MHPDSLDAYAKYSAAWNATTPAEAAQSLERCWPDSAMFFDPENMQGLSGPDALAAYIAQTHAEMPGLIVSELADPEILGNRLRVKWVAQQDGIEMFTGTDFVEFGSDGTISQLTMFYDSVPD